MSAINDIAMSRLAVIDIGSNSVRLVIYELYGVSFTPIHNEKVLAGLGRDLKVTGLLSPDGKVQALAALHRFKILLEDQYQNGGRPIKTVIAATAALRDAADAPEFIKKIRQDIGFDIQPLSGKQEAYMSAMGVVSGDRRAEGLVADLGGASLELISLKDGKAQEGISFPLGPFSMYQGGFRPKDLRPKVEAILHQQLNFDPNTTDNNGSVDLKSRFGEGQNLYLIGGAWRNLLMIHQKKTQYPLKIVNHYRIKTKEARDLARWAHSEKGAQELLSWSGLSPRRADTLPYSGLILDYLIDKLNPKFVILAPGGLREGVVYDHFDAQTQQREELLDGCFDLAKGREAGDNIGEGLYGFLTPIADRLDQRLSVEFSKKAENRLRLAACILSGIGKGLHPDHKARLVFRSILYAPFAGLHHEERAYLALMLFNAYTSKPTTPNDKAVSYLLSSSDQERARMFGSSIRAAIEICGRNGKLLQGLSMEIKHGQINVLPTDKAQLLMSQKTAIRLKTIAKKLTQAL